MNQPSESGVLPGNPEPAGTHDLLAERGVEPASMAAFAARRAELGMSLEDVANQLKFAPRLIEALEAGDFDKLPGRTFARGMLRSYAKLLKIDPAPYVARIGPSVAQHLVTEQAVSLRAPIPFSEGGRHVNLVYMLLSLVFLAVVAFFAFEWFHERSGPAKLAFVAPGREVPAIEAPARSKRQTESIPAAAQAAEERPATFASAGPAPIPETAPRTDAVNATSASNRTPLAPGRGRIVMRFDKDAWVEIKARNGQTLLSQLNPGGTEKTIEGVPPFELTIGNAPNVHVTYNDQTVDLKPHFKVDVARITLN